MEVKTIGSMSLERFIKEVLVGEVAEIKDNHPYLAFSLVGECIEFLGKIISDASWGKVGNSEKNFIEALKKFDALKKYYNSEETNSEGKEYNSLYRTVRCGFCHGLRPSTIDVDKNMYECYLGEYGDKHYSKEESKKILYFNINQLYDDFVSACNELIEHPNYVGKGKSLDMDFLHFHEIDDMRTT